MKYFGLYLEETKTRLIYFGRFAEQNLAKNGKKPETFDFLGFTHYCSKTELSIKQQARNSERNVNR